jgi:ATP-dependent DNA ligase
MQVAGALATLDSESKISPLSSPLGASRVRESRRIAEVEFTLVVGWTDPEGSRPYLGALLLAYYDPDERLVYAGRAGTGIKQAELARLWRRLQPLATSEMPLAVPPPRNSLFGSPLVLSRVHWVRPELVAEVKYLTWTADNLLRQVVYEGLREDKPAAEVRREVPYPSPELSTIDSLARTQSSKG